jgi:uncharacterized membrane protein
MAPGSKPHQTPEELDSRARNNRLVVLAIGAEIVGLLLTCGMGAIWDVAGDTLFWLLVVAAVLVVLTVACVIAVLQSRKALGSPPPR